MAAPLKRLGTWNEYRLREEEDRKQFSSAALVEEGAIMSKILLDSHSPSFQDREYGQTQNAPDIGII